MSVCVVGVVGTSINSKKEERKKEDVKEKKGKRVECVCFFQ